MSLDREDKVDDISAAEMAGKTVRSIFAFSCRTLNCSRERNEGKGENSSHHWVFFRHRQGNSSFFADRGWNVVATMRGPTTDTDLGSINNTLVVRLDVEDRESI